MNHPVLATRCGKPIRDMQQREFNSGQRLHNSRDATDSRHHCFATPVTPSCVFRQSAAFNLRWDQIERCRALMRALYEGWEPATPRYCHAGDQRMRSYAAAESSYDHAWTTKVTGSSVQQREVQESKRSSPQVVGRRARLVLSQTSVEVRTNDEQSGGSIRVNCMRTTHPLSRTVAINVPSRERQRHWRGTVGGTAA